MIHVITLQEVCETTPKTHKRPSDLSPKTCAASWHAKQAKVWLTPIGYGVEGAQATVQLLVDSGVYKTLLSEKDWKVVLRSQVPRKAKLKTNRTKFRPFSFNYSLPILGRTKCRLKATCGQEVCTLVYVVAGETESLLGLRDAQALEN